MDDVLSQCWKGVSSHINTVLCLYSSEFQLASCITVTIVLSYQGYIQKVLCVLAKLCYVFNIVTTRT
jgi:hypothetical protein